MTREPRIVSGLREIANAYDCLICDVWGVLHNGRQAQPAAWEACIRFRETQKPVVLFSNAPRLASEVQNQLDRLGVPRVAYDAIVTSGAVTRAALEAQARDRQMKLLHIGPERDRNVYEGLKVSVVSGDEAELVLCTGFYDDEKETPDDYRERFARLIARGLTLLCVNPDIVVRRGQRLIFCAGALARLYEKMGGRTVYYGKPHRPIFDAVCAEAKAHGSVARPLVVGDGLETDIKGANGVGLDAVFVLDGIHSAEIPPPRDAAAVANLLNARGVHVVGVMEVLTW
ncbi:MAG: TIGR01459 family HAD-type hydrolase [Alphaproteobacteria bacterium]